LADLLERLLVDVDNSHRQRRIEAARVHPLIGIEDERAQLRDRAGVPNPQGKRCDDHRPHQEDIEEALTHPVAFLCLSRPYT
jgi:hypothetical protein